MGLCDGPDRNKDRKRTNPSPKLWDIPQTTPSLLTTHAPYRDKWKNGGKLGFQALSRMRAMGG